MAGILAILLILMLTIPGTVHAQGHTPHTGAGPTPIPVTESWRAHFFPGVAAPVGGPATVGPLLMPEVMPNLPGPMVRSSQTPTPTEVRSSDQTRSE